MGLHCCIQFSSGCGEGELLSSCGARASPCSGFSYCRAMHSWTSVVAAHELNSCSSPALERRLRSDGTQALLLRGMGDLPGSEIEPMSPALQADSLPLSHLGSLMHFFLKHQLLWSKYPLKTQAKCHHLQEAFLDASRCANLSCKSWVTISKVKGLFKKKKFKVYLPFQTTSSVRSEPGLSLQRDRKLSPFYR